MSRTFHLIAVAGLSAPCAVAAQDLASGQEIVVTGTRSTGHAATDSPAPVDVYRAADLTARGLADLPRALQFIAPSFNFPRSATAPSAANTRAATLRGLAPDQVLLLVNGKRWHASSVVNFNNVIGRGSVPVDLATIPLTAIERIEVLRDGAAAQYGSDAIAGVINIVLKSGADSGSASVQSGLADAGDGALYVGTVNKGFRLGERGSLTATAEIRSHAPTNRAGIDSRYGRITNRQGDPDSLDVTTALNVRYDLGTAELYGDMIYAHRRSISPAQYRAPEVAPALYPLGFVPLIHLNLDDAGGTLGLRGRIGGWSWDVSDTPGYNDARFRVSDTVNTALGAASPTRFDAGGSRYFQNVANLTLSRPIMALAGGNLAIGAEQRHEHFSIRPGETASFSGAGAQGFPGFNPASRASASRDGYSIYLDTELKPIRQVNLGGAVRYDHYDDFGGKATGKLSALVRPTSAVAVRATASTGFRAPSLQQQGFSTVTSQSTNGVLVNVGTFTVDDPVSRALGARPLKAERSRSLSGGIVLTPGRGLSLSVDAFHISIKDRIALSDTLAGAAVTSVLRAAGITNASSARFFTNALDTTTRGYEVVAAWRGPIRSGADLSLNAAYSRATTRIDAQRANATVPTLPLLGTFALDLLTTAQPRDKLVGSARLAVGSAAFGANLVRFGRFKAIQVVQEQVYSPVTTVDLTADIDIAGRFSLGLGVLNIGNAYPDRIVDRALTQGGSIQYPEVGAIGTNGREFFARATVHF